MRACSVGSHVQFFCNSVGCSPPGPSVYGIFQTRILEWVVFSFSKGFPGFPNPGIKLVSPALAGRFFTTEPPGKPLDPGHFSSFAQSFLTLWDPMNQASLSITNSWSLLKFMSIEAVMSFKHFILCCPLLIQPSVFPSIMVFS